MIHGVFAQHLNLNSEVKARGFYTTRWVMATNEAAAAERARKAALDELQEWYDVREGVACVALNTEDIQATGPWRLMVQRPGRGFSFYTDE
jgi:hypothetical protein